MAFKIVQPTDTKYYKLSEWVQPNLNSNTSYGTVNSSYAGETHPSYHAFDGDATTWWEVDTSYSGFLQWKLPQPIVVKELYITGRSGDRPNITVRCYTSPEMVKPIGKSVTTYTEGETKKVEGIPENGILTDTLYFHCSSNQDYCGIGEVTIKAYNAMEVSASDDYDYIEVLPQSYNFIKEVPEYYKNVTRYYRYIEQSWVQPILTENGAFEVNNFAVRASSERDIRMAYKAFDGSNLDSEVDCWHTDGGAKSGWLSWYSKNPMKILSLTIYNRPMWNDDTTTVNSIKEWELQVSDDGITWRTIKNGTNGDNEAQSGWGITVDNTVQVFSNYWRLNILSSNGADICVGEIKISAIAKNSYEVNSTDNYDYAETTLEQVSPDEDYDSIETFGGAFKALWKNPISYNLMVKADKVLTSTFIKVNGKEVRTDAYGYIKLDGFYGEDTSFYIQYGNWSKVITIRFGEKVSQVILSPDFEIITIKYPSGALVANKTVQIGGVNYTTDSNGEVTIYGSYTSSKSLYFYLDGNNYVTKTITYRGNNTTITLEAHVIAGSISASVWNYSSSSWDKKALTFTAPTYVKVIKLTGSGFDGWSDEASDPAYVGTSSSSASGGGTVIFSGTGSFTKYLGVTPGKTYTLYGRWISGGTLAYSDDINKQSVNVNLG